MSSSILTSSCRVGRFFRMLLSTACRINFIIWPVMRCNRLAQSARPLWLRQFSFLTFDQLLGAPAKTLFRRFFLNLFLMGSPAGVLLGMPNQLSPLEFLHVWLDAFIWWFGYVMAIPSSDVLMGRLLFQRYFLWISMPPCLHFIVWLVGWQVLNLTLHEINLVQHEWHHL